MKSISACLLICLGFSLSRAEERIMVEDAKINGTPVRLAFDTGADDIYLFSHAVKRLGLHVTPVRNIWRQRLGMATEKSTVQFWSFTEKQRLQVIGLPPFTSDDGAIDGVIGWETVWDKIMVFDTASNSVRFVREVPAQAKQWTKLKLSWDPVLIIKISDHDKSGRLAIDTGSTSGLGLSAEKWGAWKVAHAGQLTTIHSAYMPGPRAFVVQEQAWASEFTLGPLSFSEMVIEQCDPFSARNAGKRHMATLGLAALKRLDLVVDGTQSRVYVRPKKTPASPYEHNRLGATFLPPNPESDPLIARVILGSPADEAGIRSGDELLKVAEEDVTKWRMAKKPPGDYWERPAGTQIPLTLRRSNEVLHTTVTLRDILPPQ